MSKFLTTEGKPVYVNVSEHSTVERKELKQLYESHISTIVKRSIYIDLMTDVSIPSHWITARTNIRKKRFTKVQQAIDLGFSREFISVNFCDLAHLLLFKTFSTVLPRLSDDAFEFCVKRMVALTRQLFHSGNQRILDELKQHTEFTNILSTLSDDEKKDWERALLIFECEHVCLAQDIFERLAANPRQEVPDPSAFLKILKGLSSVYFSSFNKATDSLKEQITENKKVRDHANEHRIVFKKFKRQNPKCSEKKKNFQNVSEYLKIIDDFDLKIHSATVLISHRNDLLKKLLSNLPITISDERQKLKVQSYFFNSFKLIKLCKEQIDEIMYELDSIFYHHYSLLPSDVLNQFGIKNCFNYQVCTYTLEEEKQNNIKNIFIKHENELLKIFYTKMNIAETTQSLGGVYGTMEAEYKAATYLTPEFQPFPTNETSVMPQDYCELIVSYLQNLENLKKNAIICSWFLTILGNYEEIVTRNCPALVKPAEEVDLTWLGALEASCSISSKEARKKCCDKQITVSSLNEEEEELEEETPSLEELRESEPLAVSELLFTRYERLGKQLMMRRKDSSKEIKGIVNDCRRHLKMMGSIQDYLRRFQENPSIHYISIRSASILLEQTLTLAHPYNVKDSVVTSHDHIFLADQLKLQSQLHKSITQLSKALRLGVLFSRYPNHYREKFTCRKELVPQYLESLLKRNVGSGDLVNFLKKVSNSCMQLLGLETNQKSELINPTKTIQVYQESSQSFNAIFASLNQVIKVAERKGKTRWKGTREVLRSEIVFHLNGLREALTALKVNSDARFLWLYGEAILTHLQVLDEELETLIHFNKVGVYLRTHNLEQWRGLCSQFMTEEEIKICQAINIGKGAHYLHQWRFEKRRKRSNLPLGISWRIDAEKVSQFSAEIKEAFIPHTGIKFKQPKELGQELLDLVSTTLASAFKRSEEAFSQNVSLTA